MVIVAHQVDEVQGSGIDILITITTYSVMFTICAIRETKSDAIVRSFL